MFDLRDDDLRGPILDCPGGAGDLGATVRAAGGAATSVDPLYALSIGTAMGTARGSEDAGTGYGKLRKKRLKGEAERIGVNEFAQAKVGEGLATYGTHAPGGGGGRTWGYHDAGVVARSGDGADYVTLENYNRGGDVDRLVQRLYFDLYKRNKQAILTTLRDAENADDLLAASNLRPKEKDERATTLRDCLRAIVTVVKENEGIATAQAKREANEITQTQSDLRWFFKLYGSHKGQSFHEQMAESGYFADPITLRVRKPH